MPSPVTVRSSLPAALFALCGLLACGPGEAATRQDRGDRSARTIAPLLDGLKAADPGARAAAACGLADLGAPGAGAIAALEPLLADDHRIEGLPCRDEMRFDGIRQWIGITTPGIEAAEALAELAPESLPALERALGATSPVARANAAYALGESGEPKGAALLVAALDDTAPPVRARAAQGLGKLEEESAAQGLVELLGDAEASVRLAALEALSELEYRGAESAVAARLADPDSGVRDAAAEALGNLGSSASLAALEGALDDPSWRVRSGALDALPGLGGGRGLAAAVARRRGAEP